MAYDPHADVKAAIAVSEHVLAACDDRFVKLDRDVLQRLTSASRRMLTHEDTLLDIKMVTDPPSESRADYVWNPRNIYTSVSAIVAELRQLKASAK